jgi:hypothetical protein
MQKSVGVPRINMGVGNTPVHTLAIANVRQFLDIKTVTAYSTLTKHSHLTILYNVYPYQGRARAYSSTVKYRQLWGFAPKLSPGGLLLNCSAGGSAYTTAFKLTLLTRHALSSIKVFQDGAQRTSVCKLLLPGKGTDKKHGIQHTLPTRLIIRAMYSCSLRVYSTILTTFTY